VNYDPILKPSQILLKVSLSKQILVNKSLLKKAYFYFFYADIMKYNEN